MLRLSRRENEFSVLTKMYHQILAFENGGECQYLRLPAVVAISRSTDKSSGNGVSRSSFKTASERGTGTNGMKLSIKSLFHQLLA